MMKKYHSGSVKETDFLGEKERGEGGDKIEAKKED